ncbi:MAG: glycosyltransferase family 4 protein [Nitrospirae bacterium]|nr:glycosyltransferase family 4 protein [Nitrospirota bacterium]
MKILHISNFYYDRGGDCTHLFSMMDLLGKKGHKNIAFSMRHPQNFDSEYSKYFISYINYVDELKNKNLLAGARVLYRSIYSLEAKKNIEKLINEEKPDIAHIQSLHHYITHSILYPLKKNNIPVVWTLHDFAFICPNTNFTCSGKVCEKCKISKLYWPIITRCKKNSLGASTVAALETLVHRIMKVSDMVDVFITPSEFLRNKLIEYGFDQNRIKCLNNFMDFSTDSKEEGSDDYYAYIGRLVEGKGIKLLIDAAIKSNAGILKIVGDGPLKGDLMSYVQQRKAGSRILFLGHKSHDEVMRFLKRSRFMVLPSEWYENFPYSVIEAFACGKAVIGARLGGIPELVRDNVTGLTFEPGNSDDLRAKIEYLISNPDKAAQMGANARQFVEQELSSEKHYQKLMEIYDCLINKSISV